MKTISARQETMGMLRAMLQQASSVGDAVFTAYSDGVVNREELLQIVRKLHTLSDTCKVLADDLNRISQMEVQHV